MTKKDIFIGKGGVGKTTVATGSAVFTAQNRVHTAIIDYDGGHSVRRTLGVTDEIAADTFVSYDIDSTKLDVAVVSAMDFVSIEVVKNNGGDVQDYLNQFPDDFGLVPLNDMCREFFGLCTDIDTLLKIVSLMRLTEKASQARVGHIVIDVEPTAGLKHLLLGVKSTARSIRNLAQQGKLTLMAVGAKWPDIKAYLESEYIGQADYFADRLEAFAKLLGEAEYSLVTIGERSPAEQTFDVRSIVEDYGASVSRCILNNLRGEEGEDDARELLLSHDLPIVSINRDPKMQLIGEDFKARIPHLCAIGRQVYQG